MADKRQPIDEQLRIYRRRLPHFRLPESTYFVTWRIRREQSDLEPRERTAVADSLRHFDAQRYTLFAWVVMNDHVHVVVAPKAEYQLEHLVHSWRSFTTRQLWRLGRSGRIWQPEYMDRIVRDENELIRTVGYVMDNPWQRWPEIDDYHWVWSLWLDDDP